MEQLWNALRNIDYSRIPIGKIVLVVVILTLTQTLRRSVTALIIKRIERITSKTESRLYDQLLDIVKPCLSWLILVGGLWLVKTILADNTAPQLNEAIARILNLIVIFIFGYFVYRSSSIFGQIIANVVLHTDTELDDLLKPLMPKIFQAVAVTVLAIKVSEIFLGTSAAALVGLLGGAGITLGLLFKDILYDWFCTLVIYSDNLYREGEWVKMPGLDGFVQILNIGFRTTTLHIAKWGSIIKMPNSKMISGTVENWSRNKGEEVKWGVVVTLKIDGISAEQTGRICDSIEKIPQSIDGFSPSCIVRFKEIERNARVLEIRAFVSDNNLYYQLERNLNLAVLELLEKEGIDFLYVDLISEPQKMRS